MDEEAVYKEARKEFKDKGSYYKDYLKHGNIFYKALHWKRKDSDFEKRTIMPEARATVREAISESDSTSSKGVERDAKNHQKLMVTITDTLKKLLEAKTTLVNGLAEKTLT